MKNPFCITLLFSLVLISCSDPADQSSSAINSGVSVPGTPESDSESDSADKVYTNGRIYTVDANRSWAEALAITGNQIVAIGSNDEMDRFIDDRTEVTDLNGRMVMPGLHDAHVHMENNGLGKNYECKLSANASPDQIIADLKNCDVKRPGGWITASAVVPFVFPDMRMTNGFLNEHFPDTPIFLSDYSAHHALVNAKALELAGITEDTVSPHGGKIMRDTTTGEPTGELVEEARVFIYRVLPDYEDQVYYDAVKWSVDELHALGVTSVQDAGANRRLLENLAKLDRNNELNLNVATHLVWKKEKYAGSIEERISIFNDRHDYQTEHVKTHYAKFWIDGAPLPPNITVAGLDDAGNVGEEWLLYPQEELNEIIQSLDEQGMTAKMHVAADGAARVALNAVQYAREVNGDTGILHELGHSAQIHDDDIKRMHDLGVIAEMSPSVWYHEDPSSDIAAVSWDFRQLQEQGVLITIGTDSLYGGDLFPAMEGMLNRPGLSVDLATAVETMTINGARAIRLEDSIGSLEAGKDATFIVLDQNIFEIPETGISETRVLRTVFEGDVVYSSGEEL